MAASSDTPGRLSNSGIVPSSGPQVPSQDEVRAQLTRILAHPLLQASRRLSGFLRFAVEKTLAGRSEELKEYVIGVEVFERPTSYSPLEDPVVRIMAGRLRSKLAEYYQSSGRLDSLLIELPKGGYVPRFAWRPFAPLSPDNTVGRHEELDQLRAAFKALSYGTGGMFTICGEAGMGKTTLAENFLSEVEAGSPAIWIGRGRCFEYGGETGALAPIFEALDALVGSEAGEQVAQLLKTRAPTWYIHLSSVTPDSNGPKGQETGYNSHERMRREFLAFLEDLSHIRPVILFLDDLHWSDASTCDLLAYMGSRLRSVSVLILATYRLTAVRARQHAFLEVKLNLESRGICQELQIPLLTLRDIELYIVRQFPTNLFPKEFATVIHNRTEGNPLFMTAMLRYLQNTHILVEQGGRWQLEWAISDIEKIIPPSVHSIIRLTMDQLNPYERDILFCAAVQGVHFDSAVIAAVLSREPADIEEWLQELETSRNLVRFAAEQDFPNYTVSVRYRFVHVFYQNVVYGSLGPSRRGAISIRSARALVDFNGVRSGEIAGELALLFESGRDYGSASKYFLQAAHNAANIFAYQESGLLCERGLRALARLPESRDRDLLELHLSMTLAMSLRLVHGYGAPKVRAMNNRCRELCLTLNDNRRLFSVLSLIHLGEINTGNLASALEVSREIDRVAERSVDPLVKIRALHSLGWTLAFMGRFSEARDLVVTDYPASQIVFDSSTGAMDPHVVSQALSGRLLSFMGYFDQATDKVSAAIERAKSLGQPAGLAYASLWMAYIHHAYGNHDEASQHLDLVIALSRDYDLPQILESARVMRGSAIALMGRAAEGIAEMRTGIERQHSMGLLVDRAYFLTLLAEALVGEGAGGEAIDLCDEALEFARSSEGRCYEPETHRVRGEVLLAIGKDSGLSEAEAEFKSALELAHNAESRLLELRAAISYCSLCAQLSETSVGHVALSQVLDSFKEGFNTPIVRTAREILNQQKIASPPPCWWHT